MHLIHCSVPGGNFGDDLNEWIWDALLPGWRNWAPDVALVGVGTILNRFTIPTDGRKKLVLGSGVGYGQNVDLKAPPDKWDVRAVRGPLSAQALGLDLSVGILDPAAMLPRLAEFGDVTPSGETLLIPHHNTISKFDWSSIVRGTPLVVVDPRGDARQIIRRIASSRQVVAESMHAAIIADAFRIPWRAIVISRDFCAFKWQDWGSSISVDVKFKHFFAGLRRMQTLAKSLKNHTVANDKVGSTAHSTPWQGRSGVIARVLPRLARREVRFLHRGPFQLSDAAALQAAQDRFAAMLAQVKRDYA